MPHYDPTVIVKRPPGRWIWVVIALAIVVVTVDGGWGAIVHQLKWWLPIAAAAGLVCGLYIRFTFTRDERLRAMHRLNPKVARRFLPPASREPDDDDFRL